MLAGPFNLPHEQSHIVSNTVFSAFSGAPKTLDPAKSYSSDSNLFISQVVEPPLAYAYYARPYELEPLAASSMPVVTWYDHQGHKLNSSTNVYETHYDIYLRHDLKYGPHPAFTSNEISTIKHLYDYNLGTRVATADDFIYAIKRLASPKVNSPIYSVMAPYIRGFSEFNSKLKDKLAARPELAKSKVFLNLESIEISGVQKIDKFHYRIITNGYYRPFIYWLSMPFFAPMPVEVDKFYSQPNLPSSIGHDWYPVGSGPYVLTKNNPNGQMILERNPNFHPDYFPSSSASSDAKYSVLQGTKLPIVDRFVFSLEKESISAWNKFLQGYYDSSGVSSDNFDKVVSLSQQGEVGLSPVMREQGIKLATAAQPSLFYIGFNMMDPIVGGKSERARLLRQAISIAINQEEFLSIFLNGRGVVAHGPIPAEIWGGEGTINHYVYEKKNGTLQRKSIKFAQELLVKAGYPNGIDPNTKEPLVLTYDTVSSSGADDKARFNWYRSQFKKLGINLDIEATQYNRFQDKMRKGQAQIFQWGWMADYPDPENFLFLLYGPNGKVKYHGENAANYSNPKFDACFKSMKNLENNLARRILVAKCVAILQHDSPWVWGFSPMAFSLTHSWVAEKKPHAMSNSLKYTAVDFKKRRQMLQKWNQPSLNILLVLLIVIIVVIAAMFLGYNHNQEKKALDRHKSE